MTRWKREETVTLILMHAHNQWSRWNEALVQTAVNLGLPLAERSFPNCSGDGSWDREWYTSAAALGRIGGLDSLRAQAEVLHEELMGGLVDCWA